MKKTKNIDYNRILKECFWDYNMTEADIQELLNSSNHREKLFLFQKILSNSTNVLKNMKIFSQSDLRELLDIYTIPVFNNEFLQKRKDIIEFIYFDKPVNIKEFKWVI